MATEQENDAPSTHPDLARRTLGGLFWMFLSTGGQHLCQLLVVAVLARLLTPTDFGVVFAALLVVQFSAIFTQIGVGPALVQYPELRPQHLRTAFTLSVLLGVTLAALSWPLAPLAADLLRAGDLKPLLVNVLRALGLIFPLQSLAVVPESMLQREMRFRWIAGLELFTVGVGFCGVGISLAAWGWGAWSWSGAHLAQNLLKTTALLVFHRTPMRPMIERQAFNDLMYFGGGFTAARIGNYLSGVGDSFVVKRLWSFAVLGIYTRAYYFVGGPAALIGGALDRVLFPAMARLQAEPERLASAYWRGVAVVALLMLPASAALVILAPEVVHVVLGPGWEAVIVPLQIMALGLLFRTSYRISDSLVRATRAVYRRAWRQALFAGLVFLGAYAGHYWGLAGVSWGVLVAFGLNFLMMTHLSVSLTETSWRSFWLAHAPALVLTGLVGVQMWMLATVARYFDAPALLTILVAVVGVLPSLWLVRNYPGLFLGNNGVSIVKTLVAQFSRMSRKPVMEEVNP